MDSTKYIGMDSQGKHFDCSQKCGRQGVMECVIETKASMILEFVDGLRGDVLVTFEEGTWAAWLYDLLNCRKSEKSESWVIRNLDSFCAASQISRPE